MVAHNVYLKECREYAMGRLGQKVTLGAERGTCIHGLF